MCGASEHFCGIPRIPRPCAKCLASFMRNAARAAGRWRRNRLCRFRAKDWSVFCHPGVLPSRQRSDRVRGETMSEQNIQDVVKQKYGEAAKQATAGGAASGGGGGELSCFAPNTRCSSH